MTDDIPACPHCDSGDLQRNVVDSVSGAVGTQPWYCKGCKRSFDKPNYRPRRGKGGCMGLAKRLLDADPSEVSR